MSSVNAVSETTPENTTGNTPETVPDHEVVIVADDTVLLYSPIFYIRT